MLERGVPQRIDWTESKRKAAGLLSKGDGELLDALGFTVEPLDNLTSLLRSGERRTALAVMLRESESAEAGSGRFNSLSLIRYAFQKADDEDLPWVVLTPGSWLRLYATAERRKSALIAIAEWCIILSSITQTLICVRQE